MELAARKLGRAGWSSVVTIFLVEGKELLAMDEEGTSDPYCKFRLVLPVGISKDATQYKENSIQTQYALE